MSNYTELLKQGDVTLLAMELLNAPFLNVFAAAIRSGKNSKTANIAAWVATATYNAELENKNDSDLIVDSESYARFAYTIKHYKDGFMLRWISRSGKNYEFTMYKKENGAFESSIRFYKDSSLLEELTALFS